MASNATSLLTQGIIAQAAIAKNQPITKTGTVAAAGGTCIGFSQTSAAIGERVGVTVLGSGIGVAGGTIAANAALQVGANGTVITQSTGAIIGRAMNAAVIGDHVEVFIAPHGNVSSGENPVTGGNDFSGDVSTLKLPAGVTDLTAGVGGGSGRTQIGLVIFGQSNERGNSELVSSTAVNQMTAYPQAFRSLVNSNITSYFPGVNQLTKLAADSQLYPLGSAWCKVYDDLYAAGYEAHIYNASIGSLSFFKDAVGFPRPRLNSSTDFRQRRAAGTFGPTDLGCQGTVTIQNSYAFECTTGSDFIAVLRNQGAKIVNSSGDTIPDALDYIRTPTLAKKALAAVAPDFTAATALGSTVTDGACVWTNIGLASTLGYTSAIPFQPKSLLGDVAGFDPYGIARRAAQAAQEMRMRGVSKIIVYICNGQSDAASTSQSNYAFCLQYLAQFFRSQGFEVCIGLSTYTRTDATAGWDALVAARTSALAALSSDTGVHVGADLYTLMGNIEGANGLTYNTAGAVGDNNAHINAQAQIVAGGHHSEAILAALAT